MSGAGVPEKVLRQSHTNRSSGNVPRDHEVCGGIRASHRQEAVAATNAKESTNRIINIPFIGRQVYAPLRQRQAFNHTLVFGSLKA